MQELYPLKFKTIYKDKIWGGNKIKTILNKDFSPLPNCGETWEISGVEGEMSVVENGFLAGNDLSELIEIYMGDLVGDKVYEKFGYQFPLLVKFIDANDYLSIQVHPDDELAKKNHESLGKTEMWYIIQADENAELISGFNKHSDEKEYLSHLENKKLKEILNSEKVKAGDVFFIPAGRVHAIGPGILLAEIQQTSDITYRIYDWDRLDDKGNPRQLHTQEALKAIDYRKYDDYKKSINSKVNSLNELANCEYFTTNLIHFANKVTRDYLKLDSFVIYICVEGSFELKYFDDKITINKGDCVLLPAEIKSVIFQALQETKVLEVYIM